MRLFKNRKSNDTILVDQESSYTKLTSLTNNGAIVVNNHETLTNIGNGVTDNSDSMQMDSSCSSVRRNNIINSYKSTIGKKMIIANDENDHENNINAAVPNGKYFYLR